jgi:hypothetical protein
MTYRTSAGLGLLLVAILLAGPVGARAQGLEPGLEGAAPDRGAQTRTFGTPTVSHTLQAFAFNGFSSAQTAAFEAVASSSRFCSMSPCFFVAALQLPAGALVTGLELTACDTTATGNVTATLHRVMSPESAPTTLATAATGGPAVPGCSFPFAALATPHEIENFASTHFVQVRIDGATFEARFQAVRVFYRLQVSPAPGAATFDDVPTGHPFFQFIEALVAAGITSGCSTAPPLYCPDASITRGQMAVFLSRALGLHFGP